MHLCGDVGVGAEGETGVIVAEDTGDGFDVYTVLQRQGGECVAEIVQTYVWKPGGLENFVVNDGHGIGVVHSQRLRGGEHDFKFGVFGVLGLEDVDGLLGQGDSPNRRLRFGPRDLHPSAFDPGGLFADVQGHGVLVEVRPEEGDQFAFAEPCSQFQEEHRQHAPPVRFLEVGTDVLRAQDVHLFFLQLWHDAVLGRIPQDQPLLHRPAKAVV